jgi:hypothetical protein
MREFDPDDPMKRREMWEADDRSSGLGMVGLIAGLAIGVMVGFLLWSTNDRPATTAMNSKPAVTTGIAPSAPPPPPDKDDRQISR